MFLLQEFVGLGQKQLAHRNVHKLAGYNLMAKNRLMLSKYKNNS